MDWTLIAAFCVAGFALCLYGSGLLPQRLNTADFKNVWFDADQWRYAGSMLDRRSGDHWRTSVHPLASAIMYAPPALLIHGFGLGPELALRVTMAITAAAWLGLCFVLFRSLGSDQASAALVTALAAVSSGAWFVFVIPETHPFGSLTVLACLILALRVTPQSDEGFAGLNLLTVAMTTTNWMYGALVTWFASPVRRFLRVMLLTLGLLTALTAVQMAIFPSATHFLSFKRELTAYTYRPDASRLLATAKAFFFHCVAMPRIGAAEYFALPDDVGSDAWPYFALSVQQSGAGSAGPAGLAAVAVWAVLLALGAWRWARAPASPVKLAAPIALAAQFALHFIYGPETVLFSLNWLPLLLALVSAGARGRAAQGLVASLIALLAWNNGRQYAEAVHMLEAPERYPVLLGPMRPQARAGISPQAIRSDHFGLLHRRKIWDGVQVEPLFFSNRVLVATVRNHVIVYDAADPTRLEPYWKVQLGRQVPLDGGRETGVAATPVIDASSVYVLAYSLDNGFPRLRLHALDRNTGREREATVVHAVWDGRVLETDPRRAQPAARLSLSGGVLRVNIADWELDYDPANLSNPPAARDGAPRAEPPRRSVDAAGVRWETAGNRIRAVEIASGLELWSARHEFGVFAQAPPVLFGDRVYAVTDSGRLLVYGPH